MALPDPSLQNKFFSFDTGFWNGHIHTNAEVKMGKVTKDARGPFFREGIFEDPYLAWEPRFDNGYPNVLWDPEAKLFRAYYTLFVKDPASLNTPPRNAPMDRTSSRATGGTVVKEGFEL